MGVERALDLWRQMPALAVYQVDRGMRGVIVTGPGLAYASALAEDPQAKELSN